MGAMGLRVCLLDLLGLAFLTTLPPDLLEGFSAKLWRLRSPSSRRSLSVTSHQFLLMTPWSPPL